MLRQYSYLQIQILQLVPGTTIFPSQVKTQGPGECGVFAVAFETRLVHNMHPCKVTFVTERRGFISDQMSYPIDGEGRPIVSDVARRQARYQAPILQRLPPGRPQKQSCYGVRIKIIKDPN